MAHFMSSNYSLLGNAIRAQRKSLGLTLQSLAQAINADAGNLSRIERGELGVSEIMLRKIAEALHCSPAYLYTQSDSVYKPKKYLAPLKKKEIDTLMGNRYK